MRRSAKRAALAVAAGVAALAGPAAATYSPPLTRVRIDADRVTHSPELVFASDLRGESTFVADARVIGAQYILQLEWAEGFGLQAGAALAHAGVDVTLDGAPDPRGGRDALFVGSQLRAYAMLWSSPASGRAHALTAFVNLRLAHYFAPDGLLTSTTLGAGAGGMAELVLGEHLSVCPYAWFTPGLYSRYSFQVDERPGSPRRSSEAGPGLKTPLQFGLDVWIYPAGSRSDQHLSLSVIASLIDTSANGSRTVSGVVGWTF